MCACDSAFPPTYAICGYCLSVSICGRKPAGTEDSLKHSEESPEKSDQDGDCRWTTGSRRFGTTPSTLARHVLGTNRFMLARSPPSPTPKKNYMVASESPSPESSDPLSDTNAKESVSYP